MVLCLLPSTLPAAEGGPIRVLLRGYAQPAAIHESLQLLSDGCRLLKGQANVPVPPLPAELLRRTPQVETEDLFDGDRWARYETTADFVVEPASCLPIIWRGFSVRVLDGCRRELIGNKGSPMPGDGEAPKTSLIESAGRCSGRPIGRAPDMSGLPVDDAGLGVSCIWSSDFMAREMKLPLGQREARSTDTCVYARRPTVALPSGRKDVVVRNRLDLRNERGGDIGALFPVVGDHRLAEFSDGTPISPTRFSREGVEAFLRQPHKQALGVAR
ncbi:hypothetical protein KAK07_19640 [Ideonella sp. 4Y16]|uniref:hypothetical protein n=1 Tax=Ideonella alba TaxID=2824118 RepID=UPI001B36097C|nr:hypothetical protein [Ideonella alba]MBQ0945562.1 hypothetical protein [Ideonella alba]